MASDLKETTGRVFDRRLNIRFKSPYRCVIMLTRPQEANQQQKKVYYNLLSFCPKIVISVNEKYHETSK